MKFYFWFLMGAMTTAAAGAQDLLDCHFVPGWEPSGQKRQYTADNLYDYKDGGAEGYLQFGFVHMQGIDCKSGANTMAIDVSEMEDADLAYGMFSANRDPKLPVAKIGMGGQVQPQSLSFAKGKYYVELVLTDAAPNANFTEALRGFAAKIQERLTGQDTLPEALGWFPKENLTESRLIPESVLGLRLLKRGYVAKYTQGQAFVVLETSPESAAGVMQKLRDKFAGTSPLKIGDEGFQVKVQYLDGICIFRKGRYIAGYANLPTAEEAAAKAGKLAAQIP